MLAPIFLLMLSLPHSILAIGVLTFALASATVLDFRTISKNIGNESILQLNTHNLNYTLGLGVDVLTSYLRFGIELKTGLGILPTRTNNLGNTNLFHFQNSPIFCIGINVEA